MERQKPKDFFISYNDKDEEKATWVAEVLENAGFKVTIQAWDFDVGSNFVYEMDKAIKECKYVMPILSSNFLRSNYTPSEWSAYFRKDPKGEKKLIKPVFIETNLEVEGLLSDLVYIDLSKYLGAAEPTIDDLKNAAKLLLGKLEKPKRESTLGKKTTNPITKENVERQQEPVCQRTDSIIDKEQFTKMVNELLKNSDALRVGLESYTLSEINKALVNTQEIVAVLYRSATNDFFSDTELRRQALSIVKHYETLRQRLSDWKKTANENEEYQYAEFSKFVKAHSEYTDILIEITTEKE